MQVKLIAKQKTNDGNFVMEFKSKITRANYSKIVGTLLLDFFTYVSMAKKHRAANFKSNEITDIKLVMGDKVFSTEKPTNDVLRNFRAKLKIRHNATGKKRFAKLLYDIFDYMTRTQENITFDELIERLTAQEVAEIAAN